MSYYYPGEDGWPHIINSNFVGPMNSEFTIQENDLPELWSGCQDPAKSSTGGAGISFQVRMYLLSNKAEGKANFGDENDITAFNFRFKWKKCFQDV